MRGGAAQPDALHTVIMPQDALPLFPALSETNRAPALRVEGQVIDYAGLAARAHGFAAHLRELGIEPEQRLLLWAHPELDSLVALVAAMLAGVVLVPVNPGVGDKELAHIVADAAPTAAFSARAGADAQRTPTLATYRLTLTPAPPPAGLHSRVHDGEEAPRLVLYTSGTTGAPKGALLCARNIAATLDGLRSAWQLSPSDTIVHALPLFHAHGLVFGLYGALRAGACLEYLPKFSTRAIAQALSGKMSVLYAVPTMYHRLADAAETDDELRTALSGARLLVSGSAALSAREHARIEALTGRKVCERYGLSETLINTAVRAEGPHRAGYVGEPLPGVEIKLVDDARQPIDARDDSTFGEVAVRGPNVFLGYLNRPEATALVLDEDGWFYTGDLATWSAQGQLRIVGRKATDLIKTGGFKVGAGEVEQALLEHPQVGEAAVLGVPDADLGERIVAFVVAKDSAAPPAPAALIDFVSRALAKHKRPRELYVVDELPKNALGKVQKARLRAPPVQG